MGECPRCGNIHVAGYCPIYGSNERTTLTPTYAEAMRSLSAETRRTRGDGNMCLFHALVGEEDGMGVIAESKGQAAALRMRAGELMANGYARRLSNESESQWNAHVKSMTKLRLRWLPKSACQATVSACAAAMRRNIVRAGGEWATKKGGVPASFGRYGAQRHHFETAHSIRVDPTDFHT